MSSEESELLSSDSEDFNAEEPEAIKWKTDLLRSLDGIKTFGDFACMKRHELFVNPGLEVAGSLIPLPLVARDAENIKAQSQQAPFGRGEETVVDTSVRKTWELSSGQFRCSNPRWNAYVNTILKEAAKSLGMPENARVEPYKLLLYEKGSFFRRHKDSEKAPGMIGTLVICLPSTHEGGDVHVSHTDKNCVFATSTSSNFDLTALAWYSDVTHEIKEITSGYRLVLTYNIIQNGGSKTSASFILQQQSHLQSLITRWRTAFPDVKRLVYRLEHKYSRSSISLRNLKGRDTARIQGLRALCAANGFYLLLATVTKTENVDEDEDEDDEDEDTIDTIELEHIYTCDGLKIGSHCKISLRDILGRNPYTNREPDSEDEGEYTGNASQPSEYRYHDSAAVIVPREHLKQLVTWYGYGHGDEMRNILTMVSEDLMTHPDDVSIRRYVMGFMDSILTHERVDTAPLATILRNARLIKDAALYRKAIRKAIVPVENYTGTVICPPGMVHNTSTNSILDYRIRELLPAVAEICNDTSSPQSSDWDDCLGPLVVGLPRFEHVFAALDVIEGLLYKDEIKPSFLEWRHSAAMYRFDHKESLGIDDHDFLLSIVISKAHESEWINNRFVPKLNQYADRALLYKLLGSLFQNSEKVFLAGADSIAGRVLEATLPRLKLQVADFLGPPARHTYGTWSSWDYETSAVASFVKFLDIFLKYNSTDLLKQLLELSCENVAESIRKAPPKQFSWTPGSTIKKIEDMSLEFASSFLKSLVDVAEKHQLPPLPPLKELFEVILRRYLLADPPTYPPPPVGWAHKSRGCDSDQRCTHCQELNRFLLDSAVQTVHFKWPGNSRSHVERQLPKEFFRCESGPSPGGGCYTLAITKLGTEYQDALRQFQQKVAGVEGRVRAFAGEYARRLLGDELYRELILLEKIRRPPAQTPQGTAQANAGGVAPVAAAPIAAAPPASGTLPAPFGNAATSAVPGGPGVSGYAQVQAQAPVAPGGGPGYVLPPLNAGQDMPPAPGGARGMMAQPQHQPSYPAVSTLPINQSGPASSAHPAAAAAAAALPPLQSIPGNASLKRRSDETWEQPSATKPRTGEVVDLTSD